MAIMATDNAYWLGKIPEDWDISRIGDYYTLRNEKVSDVDFPPLSVTMKGVVPQLATAAKTDDHDNRKLVRKGDFAINSRSDRRGSCGISDYDGSVSLINTVLTPRGQMNPRYYNWLFHTEQFADEFYKWGHGIVNDLWTTRWQEMKSILIVSPPLQEQQAIADYLDDRCSKIDEIIAEATASIEEYKELKQAVITESVTGRNTQQVFSDSKNAVLGAIPSHWKKKRIKDVSVRITVGVVVTPANYFDDNGTIPFLRGINVKEYVINDTPMVYISEETNRVLSKTIVHTNDLVIVRDGAIGVTAVVPEKFDGANVVSMIIVTPDSNTDPNYLCYVMNSEIGKVQFELTKIGAALTHTSVKAVSNIDIPFPPIEEQKSIVAYLNVKISQFDSLISEKQSLISDLQEYKKSLIYEVVTGKRRVV